ncbi:NtaA/DmoA family FMN-dependent monooxygenase [Streptomyces cucumeris]|uniref:NtaA/DmoA family FMN-dependent monooxygenase n=1 Tax=Streptomyces cucumeris TaxID=2962890 RepID=UPI003D74B16E
MPASHPGRLRFVIFTSFAPAGPPGANWSHPANRDFNYLDVEDWIKLAQAAERAKCDAIFWADHSGVHDTYRNSWTTSVREAVQFPLGDPLLLTAALASATTELGFAFSANIIQDHPYAFARRLSTLDHLTKGRIAWNIVTSFQKSAWTNLGLQQVAAHAARYERAEEYVTLLYKLLEGSWEDEAVRRDIEQGVYADPERVHDIHHDGTYFRVNGIHTSEPSPQRTPVLFQAGTSGTGRAFAARNAEAVFMANHNAQGARAVVDDFASRVTRNGREHSDLLFFEHMSFVIGSTEEEAKRKDAENQEMLSTETMMAFQSSTMGADLGSIDLDAPVGDFRTEGIQGQFKALADAAPDKTWTFRDVMLYLTNNRFVGTPEQLADELEIWRDAGVNGINVTHLAGTDEIYSFLEHAMPVLQERGLAQKDYAPGTLREKFFAGTPGFSGARISDRHPASGYRPNASRRSRTSESRN